MSSNNGNSNSPISEAPEKQGPPVGYKSPPTWTQFKKGASGNAGGVAKGTVFISEIEKRLLVLPLAELEAFKPQNAAEDIALTRVKNARSEKLQGLAETREILDRTEGKAPQRIDVSGSIDVDLNIRVESVLALLIAGTAEIPALSRDEAIAFVKRQADAGDAMFVEIAAALE